VLKACPKAKAAAEDRFLSYPEKCAWEPKTLLCKEADGPACLTAAQVEAAKKLYEGPRNPVTHEAIYPGLPRGSEPGWDGLEPVTDRAPFDSLFKWVLGPDWKWRSFDYDRDVAAVDAKLAGMLNATNPDLSIFQTHGHKLILFHGWADWLVPPQESINYYRSVADAEAGAAAKDHLSGETETEGFFRLFMVPGMAHCANGPGLTGIDPMPSLEAWVEHGVAPEEMVAHRTEKGATVMTRPVCAYPLVARYDGRGDVKEEKSFSCVKLER